MGRRSLCRQQQRHCITTITILLALRQLHWLSVDRRVDFKLCTMMHSNHTGQRPMYSSDMVNQMRSGLRSADTEIGKHAFSYADTLVWNDLPPSLHCITDSKRFRFCWTYRRPSTRSIMVFFCIDWTPPIRSWD